jgi:hypothetical protein
MDMIGRLTTQWVYGGTLAGVMLLCLSPLLIGAWPPALALTFLQLPAYMLHQYEEHDNDRFRRFINRTIGHGKDVLTPDSVFLINVPGVWGVIVVALYLAVAINPGFGLIAVYLTLVNACVHIAAAIALRMYNPGLVTAVLLFLPLSGHSLWMFRATGHDGAVFQITGFAVAAAIHIAIVAYARMRVSALATVA